MEITDVQYTYVLIVVLLHCLQLNKLFVLENKSCRKIYT